LNAFFYNFSQNAVATMSTRTKHAGGLIICIFADTNVHSTKFFSTLLLIHGHR